MTKHALKTLNPKTLNSNPKTLVHRQMLDWLRVTNLSSNHFQPPSSLPPSPSPLSYSSGGELLKARNIKIKLAIVTINKDSPSLFVNKDPPALKRVAPAKSSRITRPGATKVPQCDRYDSAAVTR
jgi:hypothetical protein